ncbi:MAG: hypothetical protein K2Z80_04555 [Xanthobacteraceae bacterium]|nr:hypothetical protein [Xanthobacteraceae bacterium]
MAKKSIERNEVDPNELFRRFAKPGEVLDEEWIETCDDLVRSEGTLVGRHEWDSGAPGIGAGVIDIYRFRGAFFGDDDTGCFGPYASFAEAAEAMGFLIDTDATTRIWMELEFERR